jgi:hypothetical protein
MQRLTKTYSDGSFGVADDLPCGENSHQFKKLLIDKLGAFEEKEIEYGFVKKCCTTCIHNTDTTRDYNLYCYDCGDSVANWKGYRV